MPGCPASGEVHEADEVLPRNGSKTMISLPIDQHLPRIVQAARSARSLVLVAPPGAGKTTRVPPAILSAGLLSPEHPNLLLLQPRRVAARACAQRIADENQWQIGREVGYQIRFEKRIGPSTRLRVMTEGILTRQLLDDPFLEGVGAVLLDEFHERSLHTDLAIALLREVRQTVRDDLLLIVMSATLAADPVARFLGHCPIIRTEGRAFPVDISHAHPLAFGSTRELPDRVAAALDDALQRPDDPGDVLVFLPGVDEIRRTETRLQALAREAGLRVAPLHGSLGGDEQFAALAPAPQRKVILATNIAETSLTIDGVRTVIDSGPASPGLIRSAGSIGWSCSASAGRRPPSAPAAPAAPPRGDASASGRRRRTGGWRSLTCRKSAASISVPPR